jgi:hypothetical protein
VNPIRPDGRAVVRAIHAAAALKLGGPAQAVEHFGIWGADEGAVAAISVFVAMAAILGVAVPPAFDSPAAKGCFIAGAGCGALSR